MRIEFLENAFKPLNSKIETHRNLRGVCVREKETRTKKKKEKKKKKKRKEKKKKRRKQE